jgi:hypothetical protein
VRIIEDRRLELLDDEVIAEGRQLFPQFFFREALGFKARAGHQATQCQGADA